MQKVQKSELKVWNRNLNPLTVYVFVPVFTKYFLCFWLDIYRLMVRIPACGIQVYLLRQYYIGYIVLSLLTYHNDIRYMAYYKSN